MKRATIILFDGVYHSVMHDGVHWFVMTCGLDPKYIDCDEVIDTFSDKPGRVTCIAYLGDA